MEATLSAHILNLAAARRQARQRRTDYGFHQSDAMTIAQAENNALRTRAALQLTSDPDFLPCDTEQEPA